MKKQNTLSIFTIHPQVQYNINDETNQSSWRNLSIVLWSLTLLGKQNCLYVGKYSSLRDCNSGQQLVQFFVISTEIKIKLIIMKRITKYLIANWRCLGIMRLFLLSLAAFPANSKISAAKYSITAAIYTGAPAPTLKLRQEAYWPSLEVKKNTHLSE